MFLSITLVLAFLALVIGFYMGIIEIGLMLLLLFLLRGVGEILLDVGVKVYPGQVSESVSRFIRCLYNLLALFSRRWGLALIVVVLVLKRICYQG